MIKTVLMVVALAAFTGAAAACFGLLPGGRSDTERAVEESCEGLEGQARVDCEKRRTSQGR